MSKITRELQDVVRKNKGIKKVYFDNTHNHYFSKHEIELHEVDDMGYSSNMIVVDSLPGAKRMPVKVWKDKKRGTFDSKLVNTEYVPVHYSLTREEILAAKPVLNHKNDEEKVKILTEAAEIMNDKSNLHILKGLGLAAQ